MLSAQVAAGGGIDTMEVALPPGAASYPALTPLVGAAFWYERVIHDQFGVVPRGHPRLAPLVLHGSPEDHALPRHVAGLRTVHDLARPGPLRGHGVHRVPGRDPG